MAVGIKPGVKRTKLTQAQLRAAGYLGSGMTYKATAREVGVNASTLHRWRQLPMFRAAVDEAADKYLREAYNNAMGKIIEQLENPDPWLLVQTARIVIEQYSRVCGRDNEQQLTIVMGDQVVKPGMPEVDTVDG